MITIKIKLGVNVSSELNEELTALTNQVNNLVRSFENTDLQIPLSGRTKGEIVEELLWQGIKKSQEDLFDLFKEKFGEGYEEMEDIIMAEEITLPPEVEYKDAMVQILNRLPEKSSTAADMYKHLAIYFNLSEEQINASMPNNPRNWHENRSQWARNSLVKENILDGNAPRGIWRLN